MAQSAVVLYRRFGFEEEHLSLGGVPPVSKAVPIYLEGSPSSFCQPHHSQPGSEGSVDSLLGSRFCRSLYSPPSALPPSVMKVIDRTILGVSAGLSVLAMTFIWTSPVARSLMEGERIHGVVIGSDYEDNTRHSD